MALKEGLLLRKLKEIVGVVLDVAISGDDEATRPGGRVLDQLSRLWLHQAHDASINGRGVKYCPAPDFFSAAFFSSRPS